MKKSKLGDKSIYVGRVSSLIKREIAVLFGKMNASLLKNMTVIDVDVLPDLSVSKIFVTFSDQNVEKNEIVNYLNKNYSYLLRKHLSQNVFINFRNFQLKQFPYHT